MFNRISNQLCRLTAEIDRAKFEDVLKNLSLSADKDYSLWRATRRFKRPMTQIPPLKNESGKWLRRNEEKGELFAEYLATVFRPNNIVSYVDTTPVYQPQQPIKLMSPTEIAKMIDRNINPKKAAGIDEIAPSILKELSRKAILFITYLFNSSLRLQHIPATFKTAQIIMLKKPDKPPEVVTSYRPISLLPSLSKLYEKLLLERLKPHISDKLPDHQFGFRRYHSTIDQIHRVTKHIMQAFEKKLYCVAVFLDVA